MKRSTTRTITVNREKLIVCSLIGLCCVFALLYMYFLSTAVMHVVLRTEVERQIDDMGSAISELETELMLAQHRVSEEVASLDGYVEPTERVFIDRSRDSLVLRDRNAP